jgi:hypothetical protein
MLATSQPAHRSMRIFPRKQKTPDRKAFLRGLVEYALKSPECNPTLFYRGEMLRQLNIDEATFNRKVEQLGKKYCEIYDMQNDDYRYIINVSECFNLKEQLDDSEIQTRRYRRSNWLMVAMTLMGQSSVGLPTRFFPANFFAHSSISLIAQRF